MLILSIITLLGIIAVSGVSAECNVCQPNGAACINSTSFYMCYGSTVPNYDKLYHCKYGFDCTDLNAICVQSSAARPASCGDTSLCGLCSAHHNYLFACTSRSTFLLCYGAAQPKSDIGYCPDGYVCDATSDNVCVPPAQSKAVTCDVLHSPNSTLPNPSTDNPFPPGSPLTAQDVCDVEQRVGVYKMPGDNFCLQYVRCYMQKSVIYGSLAQCPTGTYFNGERAQCVLAKPSHCL